MLQIGPGVFAGIQGMRVIKHPHPFCLLGADVLRGGRATGPWDFKGVSLCTPADGVCEGKLQFTLRGGPGVQVDLFHVPAAASGGGDGQCVLVGNTAGEEPPRQCLFRGNIG